MLQKATAIELDAGAPATQCEGIDEQQGSFVARAKAFRNRIGARLNRLGLKHRDFSLISNDCWAEVLYYDWELPCRTPFRGLGMGAPDFLRFLSDFERYIHSPLEFLSESRFDVVNRLGRESGWLVGLLGGDVEIYFVHHKTEALARQAWEEGCRSINFNRIAVKFTADKDGALPEHIEQFARLPFERKLLLTKRAYPAIPCAVQASRFVSDGAHLFRRSLRDFDCAHWLNTGEIRRHTLRVFLNKLLYFRGV